MKIRPATLVATGLMISLAVLATWFTVSRFGQDRSDLTNDAAPTSAVTDYTTSPAFRALPVDQKIDQLDQFLETMSQTEHPAEWASLIFLKALLLAQQENFDDARRTIEDAGRDFFYNLSTENRRAQAFYIAAFVNAKMQNIAQSFGYLEEMRSLDAYADSHLLQRIHDNVMAVIHHQAGDPHIAADMQIIAFHAGALEGDTTANQITFLTNLSLSLVRAKDFERAEHYLDIAFDALQSGIDDDSLSATQTARIRSYLSESILYFLVGTDRLDEIATRLEMFEKDVQYLQSPHFTSLTHFAASASALSEERYADALTAIDTALEAEIALNDQRSVPDFAHIRDYYMLRSRIFERMGNVEAAYADRVAIDRIDTIDIPAQMAVRSEFFNARQQMIIDSNEIKLIEQEAAAALSVRQRDRVIIIFLLMIMALILGFTLSLYQSRKMLRANAAELIEKEHRAQQAAQAKAAFLSNMSHEIRTPLNGILGMAQSLNTKDMTDNQRTLVDVMLRSGDHLLSIVNDILDLSKIEAGKMPLHPTRTDLKGVFSDLKMLWAPEAEEKGILLTITLSSDCPNAVKVDGVRFRQCVTNIVSNAIKYTNEGTIDVRVSYDHDSSTIEVDVEDTGVGIAAIDQERLFEDFEQGDNSTTRTFGGAGLGLSITRRLATAMGGGVNYVSQLGVGSTFRLSIVAPTLNSASSLVYSAQQAHSSRCNASSILLVEDNEMNRITVQALLSRHSLDILEAENGKVALDILNAGEHTFDVILLDMQMPELDGPALIKAIRDSEAVYAAIPIIAVTASAADGDKETFLALGADGYVAKPILEQNLLNTINAVCKNTDEL